MSDKTKIEWTDATANVINGCTVVSPGCANCYAMKQAHRFHVRQGLTRPSPSGMTWTGEVRFSEAALLKVLSWRRPRRIFWNAHGDTFHPAVPLDWMELCFAVMALTPQHTHQVLTKRPERARDFLTYKLRQQMIWEAAKQYQGVYPADDQWPLPNVWLGTSVEDQQRADERVPILLDTPAAVRWISAEPLLGPVDLHDYFVRAQNGFAPGIDWVVAGGESGPGARPMHPDWVVSLHDQCESAGVAFMFKQWGEYLPDQIERHDSRSLTVPAGHVKYRKLGKRLAGRKLFGVHHDGYPPTTNERNPA